MRFTLICPEECGWKTEDWDADSVAMVEQAQIVLEQHLIHSHSWSNEKTREFILDEKRMEKFVGLKL